VPAPQFISELASITEGRRALGHFVNRDEAIERFRGLLVDDPPRNAILFFYGDGGNGKSLLLRLLSQYGCSRPYPPDRGYAVEALIREPTPVPHAFLDFGLPASGDQRPLSTSV
jgi:hypothetical protein